MKQKNWFFEKINKIGKLVIKQTKKKKKRTLINKIRDGKGYITADINGIQKIKGRYF
jgi:hypothetical protein